MMRLYIDARLPWGSGIGRYVASILPHMIAARPDWTFIIGLRPGTSRRKISTIAGAHNVELREIDIAPFSFHEQHALRQEVGPHDVAWFTNYWVPFFWRSPFVATVHDLLHLRTDLFPASLPKRLACHQMFTNLRRNARAVIFVSDFTKSEFVHHIGLPKCSRVIHHGSDHFATASIPYSKTPSALIVGAPKLHKNMELAIRAWAAVTPQNPWHLTVVSPGDALRSSIPLKASRSSVTFRSGLSDTELAQLYQQAAIVLLPTRYEGFGFPILEAALNDTRILSSTADALREVARDMDLTFLDPCDQGVWEQALRTATRLPLPTHDMPDMSRNRQAAQAYRWDKAAADTLALLEEACQ